MTYISSKINQNNSFHSSVLSSLKEDNVPVKNSTLKSNGNKFLDLNHDSLLKLAKTTVIELEDSTVGHAALHIDNDGTGEDFLYDPAGSYQPPSGERTNDLMLGNDAKLENYSNYWSRRGDTVHTYELNTTPEQEKAIMNRAAELGDVSPFLCASSVSKALNGVCGIEGSVVPSTLGEQAKNATCP